MAQVKAKLHGRPLQVAEKIAAMLKLKTGPKGLSRRQWGKDLADLICELAHTNVAPENFSDYLPPSLVEALIRQRNLNRLIACGAGSSSRAA